MARVNLLFLTQNILSAMSSDQVGSIDDTEEARQVAEIIHETYDELMATRDWPHLESVGKLDGVADNDVPTMMRIPEKVDDVYWIKYDKSTEEQDYTVFEDVQNISPKEMMDIMQDRRSNSEDVQVCTSPNFFDGLEFNVTTNQPPTYWTSPDNWTIIFDSYNKDVEDTLHSARTSFGGVWETTWLSTDDFVPDLPSKMFPMLLAEAKYVAMLNLRQIDNGKEASKARRQQNTMQHRSYRQNGRKGYQAYGR